MQPAIALGITLVAFGAGYMVRGRSPGNSRSLAATKTKAASAKVVRHTDTVRVAKSDTIIVARFVYADRSAKSVAVAGDFASAFPAVDAGGERRGETTDLLM